MHLLANAIVAPWVAHGIAPDKPTLVLITGSGFLFWTVMLSQALESVTRAYYSRSDLDLILSSPASSRTLFAVRTGITALTTLVLACLLASPIVDVLVLHDGAHWLMAYLVLAALSALSTAIAVLITVALFRIAGPRRTRLIAQIIAGIVGAGFVIGIQAVAILHFGNMSSRFAVFSRSAVRRLDARPRQPRLAAGTGGARRLARARRLRAVRLRRTRRHHRLRRLRLRPPAIAAAGVEPAAHRAAPRHRQLPAAQHQAAACASRNGSSSRATPGS